MRHKVGGKKLNRNSSLRKATLRDLARATLTEQRILTTRAKAKEGRKLVEKLITLGKKGTLAHKRRAFQILCDHKMVSDLFNVTSTRFKEREGGYTRIIPLGKRRGDNADLVFLELTEKSEVKISKPKATKSGKGKSTKVEKAAEQATKTEQPEEKKAKAAPEEKSKKDTSSKPKDKNIGSGIRKMFKRKTTDK